jgi:UDP-N-acetylmuramyl pentapeptide phosphotransferase/UDP-N-acetylglucosamine-1-phosphate transferase
VRSRLTVRNHRGREVPAVLGFVLAAGGVASAVTVVALDHVPAAGWIALAGAGLIAAAGLVDDLAPGGPRGLRGHLTALAGGHVTTGIVKLFTIGAVSVVTVAAGPGRSEIARLAGVVLLASVTNLWNGLDVRPARALKFGYLALPAVGACSWPLAPFVPGVFLASLLVLPWDAGERAMLGDTGSNLLGFTVGMTLYGSLPDGLVLVATAIGVVLNVLADTLTLSRVIDAVPPLRWYDRVGTRA